MSTTPTTPQWAIEAAKEITRDSFSHYYGGIAANYESEHEACNREFSAIIAKHAPPISPATNANTVSPPAMATGAAPTSNAGDLVAGVSTSPPTDEAKLREQVMDAVLTYIHAAYFNGGVRDPMFDANLITDRILTVLAPHLSQREPGDSELLDWLETTRRALFTRDSSGVVKFDAETSATDWRCVNAPTFRQAIKSAQRGEGKP